LLSRFWRLTRDSMKAIRSSIARRQASRSRQVTKKAPAV